MSSMLEQAIVDAEALRDVALKNAEAAVVEKYSVQIKEAVEALLEQPELEADVAEPEADVDEFLGDMGPEAGLEGEEGLEEPAVDDIPLSAHDDENLCPCPDEAEGPGGDPYIEIDLDALAQKVEDELGGEGDLESHEGAAEEILGVEEEEVPLQEDIEVDPYFLKELLEDLKIDLDPQKSGWAGRPSAHTKEAAEEILALEQDSEIKKENTELRKAVERLEEEAEKINESNKKLIKNLTKAKKQIIEHKQNQQKLAKLLETIRKKTDESNILNARLLYTNKALTSNSLNERQKNTIAEALSNAKSVEEAKTIFETLQNTVGSPSKKQPNSLSEAVNKTSSTILLTAKARNVENKDLTSERWRALAGIK